MVVSKGTTYCLNGRHYNRNNGGSATIASLDVADHNLSTKEDGNSEDSEREQDEAEKDNDDLGDGLPEDLAEVVGDDDIHPYDDEVPPHDRGDLPSHYPPYDGSPFISSVHVEKRSYKDFKEFSIFADGVWNIEYTAIEEKFLKKDPYISPLNLSTYDVSCHENFMIKRGKDLSGEMIYKTPNISPGPQPSDLVITISARDVSIDKGRGKDKSRERDKNKICQIKILYNGMFLDAYPIWSGSGKTTVEYWIPDSESYEDSLFGNKESGESQEDIPKLIFYDIPQDSSMKIIRSCIHSLGNSPVSESYLSNERRLDILHGREILPISWDWPILSASLGECFKNEVRNLQRLDESQDEAAMSICDSTTRLGSLGYICGPPGTGKTFLLRTICEAFHALKIKHPNSLKGFSLGVFSSTNSSVLDLVSNLEYVVPTLRMTSKFYDGATNECDILRAVARLAELEFPQAVEIMTLESEIQDLQFDLKTAKGQALRAKKTRLKKASNTVQERREQIESLLVSLAVVIGGTNVLAHRIRRKLVKSFIDEELNCSFEVSTVPTSVSSTCSRLGDKYQSPPRSETTLFGESQGLQYGGEFDNILRIQYRGNKRVSESSNFVHGGCLYCADEKVKRKEVLKHPVILWHVDPDHWVIPIKEKAELRRIPQETFVINLICETFHELYLDGSLSGSQLKNLIGVTTPYLAQRASISSTLASDLKDLIPNSEVNTYERVLGREYELHLIVLGSLLKLTKFTLYDEKVHVAVSRGKIASWVIGNYFHIKNSRSNLYQHHLAGCPIIDCNIDLDTLKARVKEQLVSQPGKTYLQEQVAKVKESTVRACTDDVAIVKEVMKYFEEHSLDDPSVAHPWDVLNLSPDSETTIAVVDCERDELEEDDEDEAEKDEIYSKTDPATTKVVPSVFPVQEKPIDGIGIPIPDSVKDKNSSSNLSTKGEEFTSHASLSDDSPSEETVPENDEDVSPSSDGIIKALPPEKSAEAKGVESDESSGSDDPSKGIISDESTCSNSPMSSILEEREGSQENFPKKNNEKEGELIRIKGCVFRCLNESHHAWLVHQVNRTSSFDHGIAKEIKTRYGSPHNNFECCPLGSFVKDGAIINLIAQDHPGDPKEGDSSAQREVWFKQALESLSAILTSSYQSGISSPSTENPFLFLKGPLSNFYEEDVWVNGRKYSCGEQAFMHRKALYFLDHQKALEILEETNPKIIKQLGREVSNFTDDEWDKVKVSIMNEIIAAKCLQSFTIRNLLQKTENRIIGEANPRDHQWGIGVNAKTGSDYSKWEGENLLGKSWMVQRELLNREPLKILFPHEIGCGLGKDPQSNYERMISEFAKGLEKLPVKVYIVQLAEAFHSKPNPPLSKHTSAIHIFEPQKDEGGGLPLWKNLL